MKATTINFSIIKLTFANRNPASQNISSTAISSRVCQCIIVIVGRYKLPQPVTTQVASIVFRLKSKFSRINTSWSGFRNSRGIYEASLPALSFHRTSSKSEMALANLPLPHQISSKYCTDSEADCIRCRLQ